MFKAGHITRARRAPTLTKLATLRLMTQWPKDCGWRCDGENASQHAKGGTTRKLCPFRVSLSSTPCVAYPRLMATGAHTSANARGNTEETPRWRRRAYELIIWSVLINRIAKQRRKIAQLLVAFLLTLSPCRGPPPLEQFGAIIFIFSIFVAAWVRVRQKFALARQSARSPQQGVPTRHPPTQRHSRPLARPLT